MKAGGKKNYTHFGMSSAVRNTDDLQIYLRISS